MYLGKRRIVVRAPVTMMTSARKDSIDDSIRAQENLASVVAAELGHSPANELSSRSDLGALSEAFHPLSRSNWMVRAMKSPRSRRSRTARCDLRGRQHHGGRLAVLRDDNGTATGGKSAHQLREVRLELGDRDNVLRYSHRPARACRATRGSEYGPMTIGAQAASIDCDDHYFGVGIASTRPRSPRAPTSASCRRRHSAASARSANAVPHRICEDCTQARSVRHVRSWCAELRAARVLWELPPAPTVRCP